MNIEWLEDRVRAQAADLSSGGVVVEGMSDSMPS